VAENALVAELRDATGKGVARKLRAAGRIPAVVYGKGAESKAISVDPSALQRLLQSGGAGMNTLIELSVDGATRTVLVKELQRDPVRGRPLHTDFYLVELDQTVEVSVPLHLVGKAPGVELGGILDHPLREIELECLPRAIPESVDVDVSALEVGDSIHVRDLELPEGVSVQTDANLAVASVITPAVVEEPVAEEPEEGEEALAEGEEAEEGAEAAPEESAERTKGKGGE
jgi:large subunit ribosomal protein L25